jgi:tetratricopeptide (TPR) repeat protein
MGSSKARRTSRGNVPPRPRDAEGREPPRSKAYYAALDLPLMAGIVIAVIVVMAPACAGTFLSWDDNKTVQKNPFIDSFTYFWAHPHMDLYVPITYDVWAIVALGARGADGKLEPEPFHLVNVIVHILATLLVYGALRGIIGVGALAAVVGALLFGVHPVQVGSVAWISGMKDVLYAMLCLGAICVDPLAGADGPARGGRGAARYAVATALFMLAVLAKPTAMVLPVIVLALAWGRERLTRRAIVRMAPWFAIALACAAWTKAVQHVAREPAPLWLRPIVAGHALATYLWKLVAPVNLGVDYGYSPRWLEGHRAAWAAAIVPVVIAVVLAIVWRKARWVVVGAIVFVLGLLPVLGWVPFDFQFYSTVADRYLYLPMFGVAIAVAFGVSRLKPPVQALVAGALLVGLGARSWVQAGYWRDNATIFGRTLEVNPWSIAALSSLGSLALEQAARAPTEPERMLLAGESERLALRAAAVRPEYETAWVGVAAARWMQGRREAALEAYRQALALAPDSPEVLTNYAIALAQVGELAKAQQMLARATQVEPTDATSRMNLGSVYDDMGRPELAQRELEISVQLDPWSAMAHTNLGFVLKERGMLERAREEFETALRIEPAYAEARRGLRELGAR